MFIKSVQLYDFGRLTGRIAFDRDRCNIICQNNEFGKTTILDAILYALYNFPTAGFAKSALKPKERYRPWSADGRAGDFAVELELADVGGRNYLLRADFTKQQPFTLRDADTLQPIPLDGMTFGQRYLRMPLPSFTQAFFLRQDEKEGTGRNQLVSVIEEAAASNRQEAPTNVSQALELLSSPKMAVPGFCDEKILPRNLIKRLQDQRAKVVADRDALKRDFDHYRLEAEAAGELDTRITALDQQIDRWEYALLVARRDEKQTLLHRYKEGREAQAERTRMLAELEPYAAIDPGRRGEVVSLLSDWKSARQRVEEIRNSIAAELEPELEAARAKLAQFPATAEGINAEDLDSMRNSRALLVDRAAQWHRQNEAVVDIEANLRAQGVPLDRLGELQQADNSLSAADREIIFEHTASHTEAQAALVQIEQNALQAREQVAKAKMRRGWYANLGMGLTGVVVALMAVGIVLLLTGSNFLGWTCLLFAAVVGAGATLYVTAMRTRISAQELDPAIQAEMTLAAESRKIQDQLDSIEHEYQETLARLQLGPDAVQELKDIHQWQQVTAPWTAGRQALLQVEKDISEAIELAQPRLQALGIQTAAEDTRPGETASQVAAALAQAVTAADQHMAAQSQIAALDEKQGRLEAEEERLAQDLATKEQALEQLVDAAVTAGGVDVEEKAQLFLAACDKAVQLQTLRQEYGAVHNMTEDEAAALEQAVQQLEADIAAADKVQHANGETATFENDPASGEALKTDEIERLLNQARRDRDGMKDHRNRSFREAEQAVNDWRSRGPELDAAITSLDRALADAGEFAEACELARGELSGIANQVYTQWAIALNERVNEILPLLNDRYSQVALSQDLDISLYSREAGRRLETRDVQHLSKGARDQLLLAVRIAIAQYLSAHVGHLPLALDEPFAHWDDQRFVEGMRFLAKLANRHQVILLSCHHWRYDHLKSDAPDVFERLHFCELNSGKN